MREIKFRAWNGKEMHAIGDLQNIASIGDWRVIDKYEAIQQYTGLKDKNGKEIYEGDVVRLNEGTQTQVFQVRYTIQPTITGFCVGGEEDLEVIGNIYENPELIHNQTT